MIEELVQQTLKDLEKSKKEAYPLYYKEVFNNLVKSKNLSIDPKLLLKNSIDDDFLDKTKQTTIFIQDTNKNIQQQSETFVQEIEVRDLNNEIKNLVKSFEGDLLSKLSESNNKINELQDELNKVYQELNMDSLTKAYSRKAFDKDLEKIIKVGNNKELNMALVVFDIDHFKIINDTYGHLVGDFVLVKIVKLVKEIIREEDKIYRFGGDEFIILFNRIHKEAVDTITEKIRKKIENTKLKYKNNIITLTISLGGACHKKNDTLKTWLTRADKALYTSKINRNKVTILC